MTGNISNAEAERNDSFLLSPSSRKVIFLTLICKRRNYLCFLKILGNLLNGAGTVNGSK